MATDNPRVAAYPPKRIYDAVVEFKNEQGLKSDSAAIIAILENYFFSSTPTTPRDTPSTIKRLDELEGKVCSLLEEVTFLKQAYQGLQSDLQLEVNAQADSKLKTKKEKKQSEFSPLPVSESPVDHNQPDLEQKTFQDDESKESSFLSFSELPESHLTSEPISNSLSESVNSGEEDEPISDSPSESLEDIKSTSTLSDSPLGLVESKKTTGESIVSYLSEPKSDSPPKQSSVSDDNYPKTPTENSESPLESLSSSQSIKEIQNSNAIPHSLTGAALARRLDVSPSTLRHKKTARNFGKWTLGHDPDGIAWHYDGKKFIPQT
ncbi:hypothetical protein [Calothrix sp. CCY 0018]|uniref:hypothetical protein n=1 Tax=Calothrix sp. CCY 0018 TaxID=3103864 RepID=UPI0039C5E0CA